MVRVLGPVVVLTVVALGSSLMWAVPEVDASCDKSYPPCICAKALDGTTCIPGGFVNVGQVNVAAYLEKDEEDGHAFVVFEFAWAVEDPSTVSSVPFTINLEATEDVELETRSLTYTHGNDTLASSVRVFQEFTYEGSGNATEIHFTLVANAGTSNEERVEGPLGFNAPATVGEHEPTGDIGLVEVGLVASILGFILGAVIAGVIALAARRD